MESAENSNIRAGADLGLAMVVDVLSSWDVP
jgi:hypothetical protein